MGKCCPLSADSTGGEGVRGPLSTSGDGGGGGGGGGVNMLTSK